MEAERICEGAGKRLSMFNTSTTICTNLRQPVTNFFSVSGKITSSSGSAVADALVTIGGKTATTDSSGNYNIIDIPIGTFSMRVWHPDYYENLTTINVNESKTGVDRIINPIEKAKLIVNVLNSDGTHAAGAEVTADGFSKTADSSGVADFGELPKKNPNGLVRYYKIKAVLATENSTISSITSDPTIVTITLPPVISGQGAINGYILNASGIPVEGVTVNIAGKSYQTTSSGFYEFSNIVAGTYQITIVPPVPYLFQTSTITVEPLATKEYNFTVQSAAIENLAELTVEIKDASSLAPIEGADITITQQGAIMPSATLTSSSDGTAKAVLAKGVSYIIRASKPGYADASAVVLLDANKTRTILMSVVVVTGNKISGIVRDANSSAPIEGVAVSLQGTSIFSVTASDGRYLLSNVPIGSYTLVATKTGYYTSYSPVVVVGADVSKNISLMLAECFSNVSAPQITKIEMHGNKTFLKFETSCAISGYYVYRCEGLGCINKNPITNLLSPDKKEFEDTTVKPDKWYTYEIHAYFEYPFVQEKISAPATIYTGAKECFNLQTDEFCYNNTRSKCDENNTIVTISANNSLYCMQDGKKTKYVSRTNCSVQCNQPLGMFAFLGQLKWFVGGQPTQVNCTDISSLPSLSYCYKDYAKTVVSMYYSCENASSCYDYFSKEACEQNRCGFNAPGNCVWRPYSADLSLGVCMPKEEKYWNCSRCSNSKYNNLFGACNAEICDLYGGETDANGNALSHYCFFSNGECASKDFRSCENYVNEEQCLGDNGNVTVNIQGNNEVTTRSKDLLGFGLCRFGSSEESYLYFNRCFKDANNDYKHDPNPTDMKPPYTVVVHPTAANSINFPAVVYDDSDKKTILSNAETYFSIASVKGAFIRPTTLAANGRIAYYGELPFDGIYTIWFYSKDDADNLELVKSFDIYIDRVPPHIDFNYSYSNGTGLLVTLKSSETVKCSAQLYDDNGNVVQAENNLNEELGTVFSKSYDVDDGIYYYSYSCKDWVSNIVANHSQILVDTEGMIYDAQPPASTIRDVSSISVRTKANAVCRYIDSDTNNDGIFEIPDLSAVSFESMSQFSTTNGKFHQQYISVENNSIAKRYFVRCFLPETQTYTRSNVSSIRFTIDRIAPETKLYESYDITTPIEYNSSLWRNQANFMLACVDPQSPTVLPSPDYAPREFGCSQISYCITSGSSCTPVPVTINYMQNNTRIEANATKVTISLNQTKTVCFSSVDSGGNEEEQKCILVAVDTIAPRVRITNVSALCTVVDGMPLCKTNQLSIAVNGTVDNVAYWAEKGGSIGFFRDFVFKATVVSSNATEIDFDNLGPDYYDYVQLNFISNTLTYGPKGAAITITPTVTLQKNTPVNLMVQTSGESAEIFLNGVSQGTFTRTSREGWILTDNKSFSDVLVIDPNVTSPLEENLSVLINGNEVQKINVTDGKFNAVIDLSSLLSQITTEGIVEIRAKDAAGNIGFAEFIAIVDRTGPLAPPKFDPPIDNSKNSMGENYEILGYPMHYDKDDDIYYVGARDGKVYLTGYTGEPAIRVEAWLNDTKIVEYQEPPNESYYESAKTFTAAFTAKKGEDKVTIPGDVSQAIQNFGEEKYALFSGHHRTNYGNYSEAYKITAVEFDPNKGTILTLGSALEHNVSQSETFKIASLPRKPNRFLIPIDLGTVNYAKGKLQLLQFDDLGNPGSSSEILNVVIDNVPPIVTKKFPQLDTGRLPSIPNISVEVDEMGSGLRYDNVNFTINGEKKQINITRVNAVSTPDSGLAATYRLFYDYNQKKDGNYLIKLRFTDKANNPVELSWNITVDTKLPRNPDFYVTNGVNISIDPDGWTFVSGVPVVTASYVETTEPTTIVNIVNARMRVRTLNHSANGTVVPAICERVGFTDTFNCTISLAELPGDGDYALELWAVKNFSDGTTGPLKNVSDKFFFAKDTENPRVENFTITSKFIQSTSNISFSARVPNEEHRLKVTLAIEDEGKVYNLFSDLATLPEYLYKGQVPDSAVLRAMIEGLQLKDGHTYNIRINVSDYAGNVNDTENDSVTIDDTPPLLEPRNIFINATPIYQYSYTGFTEQAEATIYIVRGDNLSISGTVPPDVVDLAFYRLTGTEEVKLFSLAPCQTPTDIICINNETGRFVTSTKPSIVYGQIGRVVNNLIRIVATDRAGNTAETTKFIYADLEKPTITICTQTECVGNITEVTPPITNPDEIKSFCKLAEQQGQGGPSCYDLLIRGACTTDSILNPTCYVDYVSNKIRDPTLYTLCYFIEGYQQTCIYNLGVNSKSVDVCRHLADSDTAAACKEEALR